MPEESDELDECDGCGDTNKNLKLCSACGGRICPYCMEDGHPDKDGVDCPGDLENSESSE